MLLKQIARKKPIVNHVDVIFNQVNFGVIIRVSGYSSPIMELSQRPDQEFGIHHRPLFELAEITGFLTLLDQSVHKVKVGTRPPAEL